MPEEVKLSVLAVLSGIPLSLLAEKKDEGIAWSDN